jgi:hypothetical protein
MDDDFYTNPANAWHPANIHHDDTWLDDAIKKQAKVTNQVDGIPILRAVLGAAFIAWILLCIYLWFRLP